MRNVSAFVTAVALLSGAVHAAPATNRFPLQSAGWTVQRSATYCMAVGDGDAIKPSEKNGMVSVRLLLRNLAIPDAAKKPMTPIQLNIGGQPFGVMAKNFSDQSDPYVKGAYVDYYGPSPALLKALGNAAPMAAEYHNGTAWVKIGALVTPGLDAASRALNDCTAELRQPNRAPAIFQDETAKVSPCVTGYAAQLPATQHRLTILASGTARLKTSPSVSADYYDTLMQIGNVIKGRLRYHPATDANGNFIASETDYIFRAVNC